MQKEDVGRGWSSMRHGNPWATPMVLSDTLPEFLGKAVPLYNDDDYDKKTGLRWALVMYNEANMSNVAEIILNLSIAGLETLANAHWDAMKDAKDAKVQPWLLDEATWGKLINAICKDLNELEVDKTKHGEFLSRIGELKDPPIKYKIKTLLQLYSLPDYSKEIKAIYEMRNDVAHGRPTRSTYGDLKNYEVAMYCQRLLAKLLLKVLNFYEQWPKVHGAMTKDDLGAED